MSTVAFLRQSFGSLHQSLENAVKDLSEEQLHRRPENKGNHMAFILWHYARTEDNIISNLQETKNFWEAGSWHERLLLPEKAQGSGMSEEEAALVRLPYLPDLMNYAGNVWGRTDEYLASIGDADLEKVITMGRMVDRTILNIIGNVLLTHGYTHLGEMSEIRTLIV